MGTATTVLFLGACVWVADNDLACFKTFILSPRFETKRTRPTASMFDINHSLRRISSPMIDDRIFFLRLFFLRIALTSIAIAKEPMWSHHFEQQLSGKSKSRYACSSRAVNITQRARRLVGLAFSRKELCWLRR
uniref:Secreted protein n=1 Tax=Ixodes ricinus TaxID=34613 RepID=A0A6B0USI2_IXORI